MGGREKVPFAHTFRLPSALNVKKAGEAYVSQWRPRKNAPMFRARLKSLAAQVSQNRCTAARPRLHALRVVRSVSVGVAVGVLAREVEDHGQEKVANVADGIRCRARLMTPAFNSGE